MFRRRRDRKKQAVRIARWLASHRDWKTHGRHIPRDVLTGEGLRIERLEDDPIAQDLFLSVFHATTQTFDGPCVKVIENHLGRAFVVRVQAVVPFNMPLGGPLPPGGQQVPAPQAPPGLPPEPPAAEPSSGRGPEPPGKGESPAKLAAKKKAGLK